MSWDSTASFVSARSLDLNSVAVVHQAELEGSGDTGKPDGDFSARIDLSVADREEDKNVCVVEEKEGSGDGVHLDAKFAFFSQESWMKGEEAANRTETTGDSNNDLEVKADSPKMDDTDRSDASHLPGDANLVSEELIYNYNESDGIFKKDGYSGELEEASKSEPVGETLEVEVGKYADKEQLQNKDEEVRKSGFNICDMVWGKVRSHPWWPGQIYDPSFASDMALKHQKKDHFLVAYFGDKTFAWNDKSRLKPFESFFSQMEKQSNLNEFMDAVDEALKEVARLMEIGMTCGCIAHEFVADLKHQMVENAGIKEGTYCPALDRYVIASSFDPSRLLDYIHGIAQFPCGDFDKLELVKVNAQLKAIYMSKGYLELPKFCFGGGLSDNEEVSAHEREEAGQDDVEYKKNGILSKETSSKEKRKRKGRPPGKKKAVEEEGRRMEYNKRNISDDISSKEKSRGRGRPPGKTKIIEEDGRKQRSLPELMEQTADLTGLNGTDTKYGVKTSSKSSIKKRMINDPDSVDCGKSKKKRLNSLGDLGSVSDSSSGSRALKIGQRISRVANEMKCSRSGHHDIKLHKGKSNKNIIASSVHGDSKSPRRDASLRQDYPAPSEMLSQLCFAAKGPTKAHRFQSIAGDFFANWRDSHVMSDSLDDDKLLNLVDNKRGRKKLAESDLVPVEVKSDYLLDSYWSDVMFEENTNKEAPSRGRKRQAKSKMNQTKETKAAGVSSLSSALESTLNSPEHLSDGSAILSDNPQQEERLLTLCDDKTVEECNPTELILSFSDPNSLPSESDLIRIFSQYGPLKEAETEVSRKGSHASVMFKRGADAEVAFSSSGKFSAFGPKLVSYRLRYSTSSFPGTTPKKDPSPTKVGSPVLPDSGVVPTDGKA